MSSRPIWQAGNDPRAIRRLDPHPLADPGSRVPRRRPPTRSGEQPYPFESQDGRMVYCLVLARWGSLLRPAFPSSRHSHGGIDEMDRL
jgi:hypothetical protein